MKEKNCIITGGTSGLGLNLVKKFVNNGFFVHVIAKDNIKINHLSDYFYKRDLKSFKFYQADLAEANELSKSILQLKNLNTIDVLINNAGSLFLKKKLNSNGLEKTFVVNYLSHFFLTLSLIDLIKKTINSRIVNISSWVHKFAKLNLNDINFSERYNGVVAYNNSKLMNILFTYKLSNDYLKGTSTTTNCLHPGFVASKFGHNNSGVFKNFIKFGQRVQAVSLIEGARASTFTALSKDLDEVSGKYFDEDCSQIESSRLSHNKNLQDSLWEQSKNLIDKF